MKREFTPRPYQKIAIDFMLSTPRCALWAEMGMGKTVSTLFALDYLMMLGYGPALVLAPLRVAQTTWPQEVEKWQGLNLKVSTITGNAKERRAGLYTKADVYCMNYENIPWLVETLGDKWPFTILVADEATRLKSFRLAGGGSKRAKALAKVAPLFTHVFELSGTPAPNGLLDLWGQIWFLDKGTRLGRSYSQFTTRWFTPERVGANAFAVRYKPLDYAQDDIQQVLSDVCLSLKASDYFPLDKPIVTPINVTLPESATRIYTKLRDEMFAELQSGVEIEAVNAAAMTMKCLQVSSGALYTDDTHTDFEVVHDAKIEALSSIIEEANGAPVLVSYHWKHDLKRLLKAFPQGKELDKNPKTIADWNKGKIPVLFAHPASAGHGLNLQDGGNIIVFFSHWWDLEQYQQIIERIGPTRQLQAGHKRPVFIYHIIATGTLDEVVMQRREGKASVQELLLNAMKKERV